MLQLVILSVLLAGCYGNPFPVEERVLNGTNAQPGEIPYIVTIQYRGRSECVGSILDSRHVLTTAQCVYGGCVFNMSEGMTIQYGVLNAGNSSKNLVAVNSTTCHEDFEMSGKMRNDIAILTLKTDIPFSATVKPLVLPRSNASIVVNSTGMLSGWERIQGFVSGDLKRVDLRVYSDKESESIYGNLERQYHFCAGSPGNGIGPCVSAVASPIEVNGTVVGIVTTTYYMKPCGTPGYPGIFVKVANYVDWINRQL